MPKPFISQRKQLYYLETPDLELFELALLTPWKLLTLLNSEGES